MAITSYAELQAAAANWLARADLTSRIPEFIALAEAKFNRTLRTRDMITKDTAFSVTGEYVAVPTGFLQFKGGYLNTAVREPILFLPDDTQAAWFEGVSTATYPARYVSVQGTNFHFAPAPGSTTTVTIVYYKAIVGLATTSPNWLLTSHPDIYLYATLLEAAPFLGDDARIGTWQSALKECLGQLIGQEQRANTAAGMAVRLA